MDDFLSIWALYLGRLGSISLTCPNAQKYTKQVELNPQMTFTLEQGLILYEIWGLLFGWFSVYLYQRFGVSVPDFPDLPKYMQLH